MAEHVNGNLGTLWPWLIWQTLKTLQHMLQGNGNSGPQCIIRPPPTALKMQTGISAAAEFAVMLTGEGPTEGCEKV